MPRKQSAEAEFCSASILEQVKEPDAEGHRVLHLNETNETQPTGLKCTQEQNSSERDRH